MAAIRLNKLMLIWLERCDWVRAPLLFTGHLQYLKQVGFKGQTSDVTIKVGGKNKRLVRHPHFQCPIIRLILEKYVCRDAPKMPVQSTPAIDGRLCLA